MLKALMLKSKRDGIAKLLAECNTEIEALNKREAELESDIQEVKTDEERAAVEEAVNQHETDMKAALDKKADLERQISEIEAQIAEIEAPKPEDPEARNKKPTEEKRTTMLFNSTKFFRGMKPEEVRGIVETDEVKSFLANLRSLKMEKRAVTGAELGIPVTVLPIIREKIEGYSKLLKHVNLIRIKGEARQVIAGTIPEAIWTEQCAKLNEVAINFNDAEIDGYKIGAYINICTATLEDNDIMLADVIFESLAQSIGYGVDKAIIYGTDVKMPKGIVTRLAEAVQPAGYPATARTWVNLSTTNIGKTTGTSTGLAFYKELINLASKAKSNYAVRGNKFWAMNESTKLKIMSELLAFNAAGAVTADINGVLPIISGTIETLPFMPDGDVVGGYGECYLMVERHEMKLASSDLPRWVEDETSFKATARYDGEPVIAEAFAVFNVNGVAPATTATFAPDTANTVAP